MKNCPITAIVLIIAIVMISPLLVLGCESAPPPEVITSSSQSQPIAPAPTPELQSKIGLASTQEDVIRILGQPDSYEPETAEFCGRMTYEQGELFEPIQILVQDDRVIGWRNLPKKYRND